MQSLSFVGTSSSSKGSHVHLLGPRHDLAIAGSGLGPRHGLAVLGGELLLLVSRGWVTSLGESSPVLSTVPSSSASLEGSR